MKTTTSGPWRKLLWVKQPYPDNYVDDSFLSQLKRNSNVQIYSFKTLVRASSVGMLHLCSMVLFVIAFVGIYTRDWDPRWFACSSVTVTIASFIIWDRFMEKNKSKQQQVQQQSPIVQSTVIKSSVLIVFAVLALSPVLKSLTQSISSDSIWSISCWLSIANMCFHDYSYHSQSRRSFKVMLSTNLAMSTAIVVASRLPSSMSVFWFILYSIQIFVVLPTFALWLRQASELAHWSLVASLLLLTDIAISVLFGIWAVIVWISVQLTVMTAFPGWFLALQKYKNEIQGPWDPARPILSRKSTEADR